MTLLTSILNWGLNWIHACYMDHVHIWPLIAVCPPSAARHTKSKRTAPKSFQPFKKSHPKQAKLNPNSFPHNMPFRPTNTFLEAYLHNIPTLLERIGPESFLSSLRTHRSLYITIPYSLHQRNASSLFQWRSWQLVVPLGAAGHLSWSPLVWCLRTVDP